MTAPLDLAALRGLVEQATRGPWLAVAEGDGAGPCEIATVYGTHGERGYTQIVGERDFSREFEDVRTADAALITAAVNALPALLDELEGLRGDAARLERGLKAVSDLIDASQGVYGLHLNGDIAPWESLREGGRFEEWLLDFDAAIDRARGEGR